MESHSETCHEKASYFFKSVRKAALLHGTMNTFQVAPAVNAFHEMRNSFPILKGISISLAFL